MQDLAGMRIVTTSGRDEQDEVVEHVRALFGDAERPPKVIDRRVVPMHGYCAVHVIVFPEGLPIEIQVRTARQHEWAELFEKLADLVGRGIRYGEPPETGRTGEALRRFQPDLYENYAEAQKGAVEVAQRIARIISLAEQLKLLGAEEAETDQEQEDIDHRLGQLQAVVSMIEEIQRRVRLVAD